MASKPYADHRRGIWRMKHRPNPTGPWVTSTLGKDNRLKTKNPPQKPPADIAAMASELADQEYRARHNLNPSPARPRSIDEYIDAYVLTFKDAKDEGSVKLLERYADRFRDWCERHGVTTIQGVTKGHCRDFIEAQLKDLAPSTMKTARGYLSPIWSRAVEDGLIAVNPWFQARLPKGTKTEKIPTFWTSDEIGRIVKAARQEWHQDLILVLANTGIRVSGTLAMEWKWINWHGRTIDIPAAHNKGGFAYTIAMADVVHDVLARRLSEATADYAFASPKQQPYTYEAAKSAMGRAVKKAKVPEGTLHDLRHTFGRALHLAGVPQGVISAMLGHSSLSMTELYTKTPQKEALAFMKKLDFGLGLSGPCP
jgi:integrase